MKLYIRDQNEINFIMLSFATVTTYEGELLTRTLCDFLVFHVENQQTLFKTNPVSSIIILWEVRDSY
jgi:hypothetical protein